MLVKLNLSFPLLVLILNHLLLSLIFGALVLTCSLTSRAILLTLTLMHSLQWHDHTVLVLTLVVSFLQSLSHCCSLTPALSLIQERLVFYKCLFLYLVLMVMVSEKLGLVLGFDGDGNACFRFYVCIASY